MNIFEVYLLKKPGTDRFDTESVLDALLAEGLVHLSSSDPVRAIYQNPDTGVFFQLTLAPPLADLWRSRSRQGERGEGEKSEDLEEEGAAEGDAEESADDGEFGEEPDEEEDDDEDEEEEAPHDLEMTPVVLNLVPLAPAFFAREALEFAGRIAQASDLHLEHLEPRAEVAGADPGQVAESQDSPPGPADIFSIWDRSRREQVKTLLDEGKARLDTAPPAAPQKPGKADAWDGIISAWSAEKAEAWWRFGSARARLAEELGGEVRVPLLQAARHEGRVKTLCDWDQGSAIVLPRTDLVLLRRERSQKGLFRTRRVVEEGLISGETLWEILAGASERRYDPVDLLIFREAATPPQDVAARLETLVLEPLAGAKRASLFGVIDFDPEAPSAEH